MLIARIDLRPYIKNPSLIMAENKDSALQKAFAINTDYLIKRIQDRNCINIRVSYIREISAELENTKDAT